ncbi:MAG TPA: EscU/YscU/HrcU family type III secretion system export apparatus switch protein [Caulobacteraceae bacterium]|nr:EscU/YscU/HrcU family type III secretion system export apparatus switch protein [Caulobacteraceae bacterium]
MSEPDRKPLAVALRYDRPRAPRVVATGRGDVGRAIIEAAKAHGVPLEPNPELAEALASVPLDDEIPEELYRAVATVIAFVLRTVERAPELKP